MTARNRLAVDIGGTFTDLVLALPDRTLSAKLLTTHGAPDEAVIAGTRAILREAGIAGIVARSGDPRHDARHQCADRTQGCGAR